MPATSWQRRRSYVRVNMPWRRLMKNRTVRRRVQGVDLFLPWGHRLPDYARHRPTYGQNLVQLARALSERLPPDAGPLRVLDIGANVGDSAAQILAAVDARVLCVEGDPHWARYLHQNLDGDAAGDHRRGAPVAGRHAESERPPRPLRGDDAFRRG